MYFGIGVRVFVGIALLFECAAMAKDAQVSGRNANKVRYKTQTFDAAPVLLNPAILSIGDLHREAARWGGTIPALDVSLLCEIADDGTIDRASCEGDISRSDAQMLALNLLRAASPTALPQFPAIDRAQKRLPGRGSARYWSQTIAYPAAASDKDLVPFYRLARLVAKIQSTPSPAVDLTSGPLVELGQIAFEEGSTPDMEYYPPLARRWAMEGVQIVECQVQVDRSVICRDGPFDPPANARYFAGGANNMYRAVRIQERLKNGASSIGARFQYRIQWVLQQ